MSSWVRILNNIERDGISEVQEEILEKIIECNYELDVANEKLMLLIYGEEYSFKYATRKSIKEFVKNSNSLGELIDQVSAIINNRILDTKEFKKYVSNSIDKIMDDTLVKVRNIPRQEAPIFKKRMMLLMNRVEKFAIDIYTQCYNETLDNIKKICELLESDRKK